MENKLHTKSASVQAAERLGEEFGGGGRFFVLHMTFNRLHLSSMAVPGFIAAGGKKDV
jgi:hypothetical protein